jgi:hypothetical protein
MKQFALTCCSTSDMPREFFDKNNIGFACFHFILDGKEYPDDLGRSVPFDLFYKKIADGSTASTSQVSQQAHIDICSRFSHRARHFAHYPVKRHFRHDQFSCERPRLHSAGFFPTEKNRHCRLSRRI